MNYFISTMFLLISRQAETASAADNIRQVMIPDLSAADTKELLHKLSNFAHDKQIQLEFRIADEYKAMWDAADITYFENKDAFAKGSLTLYRNQSVECDKISLTVLSGTDLVTDAGSLKDFYRCDDDSLWREAMSRSFDTWTVAFAKEHGILEETTTKERKFFGDILDALYTKSNLVAISRLLERDNIGTGHTSFAALVQALLSMLDKFSLPNLEGFNEQLNARRGFPYYLDAATAFFNYSSFIENTKKNSSLTAIESFRKKQEAEEQEIPLEKYQPAFSSQEEYLDALRLYINTNDYASRTKLLTCDFVYIHDSILGIKPKKESKKPKNTLVKLDGSPVEVVLSAVWQAFGGVDKSDIQKIKFTGKLYCHDLPLDGTNDDIKDDLKHLLGGLDEVCEDHIQIALDQTDSDKFVQIESNLINDDISTRFAKTAEPYFEFWVEFEDSDGQAILEHAARFALKLPESHPYRLAEKMFALAKTVFAEKTEFSVPYSVPVFHLEYYKEFMMAREYEEQCRVLFHCLNATEQQSSFAENIFTKDWVNHPSSEKMKPLLQGLSLAYKAFIHDATENGLYAALKLGGTPDVFFKYNQAAEACAKDVPEARNCHELAALLMRSFLVLDSHSGESKDMWSVRKFEASGIVTILHPALLEMLQSQTAFLFAAFSKATTTEFQNGGKFKKAQWEYYTDMAEMKMPLTGLMVNCDNKFEVGVSGQGLLHKIGGITPDQALAATRFLIRYDRTEDDDVTEAELFRETSESRHLSRIFKEFNKMHVNADDGISIVIYRNEDIQPVLAAINNYVLWLNSEKFKGTARHDKYSVDVVFFSESSDTSTVTNWLRQWQEFLDDAEEDNPGYADCRFSVSQRIVKSNDNYRQFAETIQKEIDADIFVFYNFIKPGSDGCEFRKAEEFNAVQDSLKFPVLEKAQCSSTLPSMKFKRSQVVSNRQFKIATSHAEIIARLRDANQSQGLHHIVLASGDFSPWQNVIDKAHETSEWVVCVDACVDEALIGAVQDNGKPKRELIGYGSGVGFHGENNYTISTQQFFMDDIRQILLKSIKSVYNYGDNEHDMLIANRLLSEAKALAGISLIRALGPSEYVRDFMAYCLMHRILPLEGNGYLCNKIFSIDAYRHWFDQASSEDRTHPDLLWICAQITDSGIIHVDARLVECKMANENPEHIKKAKLQIENGLKILRDVFTPNQGEMTAMHRPDQRYWYLQLHRLIASCARIDSAHVDESEFLQAMEYLTAGKFTISWGAGIFAFWTDSRADSLICEDRLSIPTENGEIRVPIYSAGYDFVYKLCKNDSVEHLTWDGDVLQTPALPAEEQITERVAEPAQPEELENDVIFLTGENTSRAETPTASDITVAVSPPVIPQSEVTSTDAVELPNGSSADVSEIPDRILLGKTINGNREVYWEFGHPRLNNRHFLIFGNSGTGKTYAIQAILCELGRMNQNSLIVDYTNGFLKSQLQEITKDVLAPFQYVVKTKKLPLHPFAKQMLDLGDGDLVPDNNIDIAKRVTSIFDTVYNLGDQQKSILIDAIKAGLDSDPQFAIDGLIGILESFLDDGHHPKTSVTSIISKLKPFISEEPFAKTIDIVGWDKLYTDTEKHCSVFQMAGMDRTSYLILSEFILWDLYSFVRNNGSEKKPKVVVLDEVQNLDQKLDAPLGKFLTEGRKFGISLIAATQTLSNLRTDEQARLFQAAHKLFFHPADPEVEQYARLVRDAAQSGDVNEWKQKLASLGKGECLSIGPGLDENTGQLRNSVQKIRISSLEERGL